MEKKKKKQAWQSAPVEEAPVEEVPETPPPGEEQLRSQRIQELFQTFGPEEKPWAYDPKIVGFI